jgi:hypothetical protein
MTQQFTKDGIILSGVASPSAPLAGSTLLGTNVMGSELRTYTSGGGNFPLSSMSQRVEASYLGGGEITSGGVYQIEFPIYYEGFDEVRIYLLTSAIDNRARNLYASFDNDISSTYYWKLLQPNSASSSSGTQAPTEISIPDGNSPATINTQNINILRITDASNSQKRTVLSVESMRYGSWEQSWLIGQYIGINRTLQIWTSSFVDDDLDLGIGTTWWIEGLRTYV